MTDNTTAAAHRLESVLVRIRQAEQRFGRAPGSVILLPVSKTRNEGELRALVECGAKRFGESYLQEALGKIEALSGRGIEWHFIGPIQSNKTAPIAAHFDWVHSVDRVKIAERLNAQRSPQQGPLNLCLQVNVSGEASKSGVPLEQLPELVAAVRELPRLSLRGLMTIPAPAVDFEQQRAPFRALHKAFEALKRDGYALDTLSMGMSDDLEAAIAEGASLVRVGTALFGPRPA